jgi:hypothetical protein
MQRKLGVRGDSIPTIGSSVGHLTSLHRPLPPPYLSSWWEALPLSFLRSERHRRVFRTFCAPPIVLPPLYLFYGYSKEGE